MATLFRVIVPVRDIERAAAFYSAILGDTGQRVSQGRHYFDCDGTILACYDPIADGDDYEATPLTEPLYFAVDDLDEVYERAAHAGAFFPEDNVPDVGLLGAIEQRPWGELSFYTADPFGNPLCFVSRDSVFKG